MKKYVFTLACFALLLIGCKKNEDITQVDIQPPEPVPLNEVKTIRFRNSNWVGGLA
jgi:hypothetical protein